jgi:hypothetical protein
MIESQIARAIADDDDEGDPNEDDFEFDCHLGRDGQCGKAGSEECDFEYPMRDSEFFAGSAAWNKKHTR